MPDADDAYRFHVPDLRAGPNALPADQATHATRVLRLTVGTRVVLFDGRGAVGSGPLILSGKDRVSVEVAELRRFPPPDPRVVIACAVPKGDRVDWCAEQLSQLNVFRLQWTVFRRSVNALESNGRKLLKLRRLAIESAKQCHRPWLMEIADPLPLEETVRRAMRDAGSGRSMIVVGDPRSDRTVADFYAASKAARNLAETASSEPFYILCVVGPEGGFTDVELEFLLGLPETLALRLAATVLRIETAAAALAAIAGGVPF